MRMFGRMSLIVLLLGLLTPFQVSAAPSWWQPAAGTRWWWQIDNTANLNLTLDVDVYDVDLFEGINSGKIAALKSRGYRVICYFSAGSYEPYRDDFPAGFAQPPYVGGPIDGFEDELWLNIAAPAATLDVIKQVMRGRLDLAASAGCDAVEPDNVDAWANDTGLTISRAAQLNYNRFLAQEAHARGLAVGLKNDLDQIPQLVADFDFAVNEQCFAYDECDVYAPFLNANKAVFNQEYGGGGDGTISKTRFNNKACPYFQNQPISALWKKGFDLNGKGVVACQP